MMVFAVSMTRLIYTFITSSKENDFKNNIFFTYGYLLILIYIAQVYQWKYETV